MLDEIIENCISLIKKLSPFNEGNSNTQDFSNARAENFETENHIISADDDFKFLSNIEDINIELETPVYNFNNLNIYIPNVDEADDNGHTPLQRQLNDLRRKDNENIKQFVKSLNDKSIVQKSSKLLPDDSLRYTFK